jgi:hypothetical protein
MFIGNRSQKSWLIGPEAGTREEEAKALPSRLLRPALILKTIFVFVI